MTNEIRTIKQMRLYEISMVLWPANPHCTIKLLDGTDGREVHSTPNVE